MTLDPLPEGIDILKGDDGKIYVINEILNFYQCKLKVLKKPEALALAHVFDEKKLCNAKEVLLKLWNWRKLTPSTQNTYIIKNLEEKRKSRGAKGRMASDIVNFFEVEDANLGITFLTLNCEVIPSKVHEREAMQDVYVLLHKSEEDYAYVTERIEQRDATIESQGNMIQALQKDMLKGFQELTQLLKNNMTKVNVANNNVQQSQQQQPMLQQHPQQSVLPSSPQQALPTDHHQLQLQQQQPQQQDQQGEEHTVVNEDVYEEISDREEGELTDDSIQVDSRDDDEWVSFALARYRNAAVSNSLSSHGLSSHALQELQPMHQQQPSQQEPSRSSYAESVRRQLSPTPRGPSSRSQSGSRSTQSRGQNMPSGNINRNNSGQQHNPYLRKKQRKNVIIDDGNEDIPFSAVRELYSYEAFVTDIDPISDIDQIKDHLKRKLGTNEVFLRPMNRPDATYLSFGVFCRSSRNNLDLRMPGLWPRGTRIFKWNSKGRGGRVGNQASGRQNHHSTHGRQRNHNRSSYRQDQRNNSANNYRFRYPDQQRLHDQHV